MRFSTKNLLLAGLCGCLLHLGGCGGSSEPASGPAASSSTEMVSEPAAPTEAAESSSEAASSGGEPIAEQSEESSAEPASEVSSQGSDSGLAAPGASDEYGSSDEYASNDSYDDPGGEFARSEMSGYGESSSEYGEPGSEYGEMGYGSGPSGGGNGFFNQIPSNLFGMMTPAVSKMASPSASGAGPAKSYLDRAVEAFSAGNEALARQYYLAHMVGEYEEADEAFSDTQVSTILRRPVWAMRWGASVHVRFSGDGAEEIHPVRQDMPSPMGSLANRRGMRRGGYGDAGGSGMEQQQIDSGSGEMLEAPGSPMGMNAARQSATGAGAFGASAVDLSEELGLVAEVTSEMFGQRLRNGDYGSAFVTFSSQAPLGGSAGGIARPGDAPGMREQAGGYGGATQQFAPGMAEGSGAGELGSEAYAEMSGTTGEVSGEMMASEGMLSSEMMASEGMLSSEMGSGGFPGQPGGAMGRGNAASAEPAFQQPSVPAPELPRWRPGIVFVGKVNQADALEKAQEHSLDFLIHFDVAVRTSQAGSAKNVTRLRVYDVAAGKTVVVSKAIDNFEVYKLAEADRKSERESVEEVLSSLFEVLDEKMVMRPMPRLDAEAAKKRVITLIEQAGQEPLRALAEIRLYQWQQAIDEGHVATAFHMAGGDDALTILHGLPEARREVLEELVGVDR